MRSKLPQGTLEKLWSDPANWRGPFYFCRHDPRTVVPKRLRSFGWTPNFAHASAWVGLLIGMATTAGAIIYLKESGREAWVFPALAIMVAFSIVSGRYRSWPARYEESG